MCDPEHGKKDWSWRDEKMKEERNKRQWFLVKMLAYILCILGIVVAAYPVFEGIHFFFIGLAFLGISAEIWDLIKTNKQ